MATSIITNNGLVGSQTMLVGSQTMRLQHAPEVNGGYPQAQRKKAQVKVASAPSAKQRASPAPSAKQKSAVSQPMSAQARVTAKPTGPVNTSLTSAAQPFAPGSLTMQASMSGDTSFPSWLSNQPGPPGTFSAQQATASARGRFGSKFMPHQLCSHYNTQGWCRKAEQCTFAHGIHELHPEVAAMYGQQQQNFSSNTLAMLEAKGAAFLQAQAMAHRASATLEGTELWNPGFADSQDMPENGMDTTSIPTVNATSSLQSSIIGTTTSLGPSQIEDFKFNLDAKPFVVKSMSSALKFNASAVPFVPKALQKPTTVDESTNEATNEEPNGKAETAQANSLPESGTFGLTLPIERRSAGSSDQSPTSLQERLAPLPLSLGEEKTPSGRRVAISMDTPTARGSPRAATIIGTPTSRTPVNARILSAGGLSPRGTPKAVSPSATMFDRSMLLKARTVAKKLEQGPPGLGMCAPTPTSAARGFGFQYPQPGYISSRRFSLSTSLPPPSGEKTTERRQRVKANAPWKKADFMSGS